MMKQNAYQHVMVINKIERKAKDRESNWGSDKNIRKHNTQESLEVSPFSADDHKVTMKDKTEIAKIKTNRIHKRSTALEGQQVEFQLLVFFIFVKRSIKIFSKRETLIKRCLLRRPIRVCTVCICRPIKTDFNLTFFLFSAAAMWQKVALF